MAPVNIPTYQRLVQRDFADVEAEVMQRAARFQAGLPVGGSDEDWEKAVAQAKEAWTSLDEGFPGCAEPSAASDKHS